MCCKYMFDDNTLKEVWNIVKDVDRRVSWKVGDISPTDSALLITKGNERYGNELIGRSMRWGWKNSFSKQLLINARAETALSKATFSRAVQFNRCLIPAKHFYEWDKEKNRNTFSLYDQDIMYMAGIYTAGRDGDHFTILTTAANDSMRKVHDRMPLILEEKHLKDWLFDDEKVAWYLSQPSPILKRYQEYEQLSLFDF